MGNLTNDPMATSKQIMDACKGLIRLIKSSGGTGQIATRVNVANDMYVVSIELDQPKKRRK